MNSEIKKLNLGDPDFNIGYIVDNDGNVHYNPRGRIRSPDELYDHVSGLDEFPENDYRDLSS